MHDMQWCYGAVKQSTSEASVSIFLVYGTTVHEVPKSIRKRA